MSKPGEEKRSDWRRLIQYLEQLKEKKFTGKVTINFFKGGVSHLMKASEPAVYEEESVKLK